MSGGGARGFRGFSDILTDPRSGEDVWVRWLWDGGAAYVVTKRDEHHPCPACDGERTVTRMGPVHSAMIEPPEYEEWCPTCCGSGEVEALFGTNDDLEDVLLWPRDADEATEGYD